MNNQQNKHDQDPKVEEIYKLLEELTPEQLAQLSPKLIDKLTNSSGVTLVVAHNYSKASESVTLQFGTSEQVSNEINNLPLDKLEELLKRLLKIIALRYEKGEKGNTDKFSSNLPQK